MRGTSNGLLLITYTPSTKGKPICCNSLAFRVVLTASVALWKANPWFLVSLYKQTLQIRMRVTEARPCVNLSLFQMAELMGAPQFYLDLHRSNCFEHCAVCVIVCNCLRSWNWKGFEEWSYLDTGEIKAEQGRGIKLILIEFRSRWSFVSFERWVQSRTNSANWKAAICCYA